MQSNVCPADNPSAMTDRKFRVYPERPRVLLVEDQEELARNLEELLRMDGFDVMWTSDGSRAVALARRWHFDAVVLDLVLPGVDGFEVCRLLRANPSTERIVIIMVTAMDDPRSKIAGLDGGADDYMVKPVISRELTVRLRKLLGERRARVTEVREERRAAIDQMATAVGHEINNPLAAALGRIDLLLLSPTLPADVRGELLACQEYLRRIGEIVARLDDVPDKTVAYVGPDKMIDLNGTPETSAT
jgi:DNA-binding response OmpR family regulator